MTTLGTGFGEWDWHTRSAKAMGSSVSMDELSFMFGLMEEKAARIAFRIGVERQFARAALLMVIVTTWQSGEHDIRTRSEEGES